MKNFTKTVLFLTISSIFANSPVFADGLVFDPETYQTTKTDTNTSNYMQTTSVYAAAPAVNTNKVTDIKDITTRQNNNMQNALFQLDSAQVDIRNQLIEEKSKYTDIDNKYKMIKEQRKLQKKSVRASEKRINELEKTKNRIRKNMQIQ